ncbi:MAG TPA: ABC transporter ATP-binding protein, partial [Candidatus Limnocylindrales bacterium]|nr:ABC transporter ATP-binding protein [Candidatus Limnocylindrales bacterium]
SASHPLTAAIAPARATRAGAPRHDVELVGVTRRFGDVVAVDDLTLSVEAGSFYSLLGPSGCGKTTTLRLVAGFEQPDEGVIRIGGAEVEGVPAYRRNVNTVFQHYALFPHMDVATNVAYGLKQRRVPEADRRSRVGRALELVRLTGYDRRRTWELSGGQQQRVALARALVNEPTVLLLDEPLGALDMKLRKAMQHELKGLQTETGITFIYVTHDQEEALTMSDRVAVMRSGRMLQEGDPKTLYEAPADRFVADFIGVSNFIPGRVVGRDANGAGRPALVVEADGGERIRAAGRHPDPAPAIGDRVVVVVRPERMRLGAAGGPGIPGRLVEATYLGEAIESRVETPRLGRLVVRHQNGDPSIVGGQAVGDEVTVRWDDTAAVALPE